MPDKGEMALGQKRRELQEAEDALSRGEPLEAFKQLRAVVDYPGRLEGDRQWKDAFHLFARIATTVTGKELAEVSERAASNPNDPKALYALGYQLIENKLHGFAAAVLSRADAQTPNQEPIITELVYALEHLWNNAEACRRLRASGLVESSWLCRYLLAFHSIMSGDLAEARRLLPSLLAGAGEHLEMAKRIEGMLGRADAVHDVTSLDTRDLRGWHFVLNGAILLHISPIGFDEGMFGRYAFTQDSEDRCLEGIRRLSVALETMDLHPARVFIVAERESSILGHAMAQALKLPAVAWHHDGDGEGAPADPGLIVAYDLSNLEGPTLASLSTHRPGQILFAHATCWTDDPPFAADLTTYLHQTNVSPWGKRMRLDPETGSVKHEEPRDEPVEALARAIVSARLEDEALPPEDVDALRRLARAASLVREDGPGAARSAGPRRRQWAGSPVKSSSFL